MVITEKDLAGTQQRPLLDQHLFDFDDELGGVGGLRIVDDLRARCLIIGIAEADARALRSSAPSRGARRCKARARHPA
jgi:hypothetical protein